MNYSRLAKLLPGDWGAVATREGDSLVIHSHPTLDIAGEHWFVHSGIESPMVAFACIDYLHSRRRNQAFGMDIQYDDTSALWSCKFQEEPHRVYGSTKTDAILYSVECALLTTDHKKLSK